MTMALKASSSFCFSAMTAGFFRPSYSPVTAFTSFSQSKNAGSGLASLFGSARGILFQHADAAVKDGEIRRELDIALVFQLRDRI